MESFSFFNPTRVHFGKGMISRLAEELIRDERKNCLLIAGGGSIRANGAYDDTIKILKDNGIKWQEAWGVKANPELKRVYEIIDQAREMQADCILAVGGGSVIDTAKAVAVGVFQEDVWKVFQRQATVERALPIYTVLTISATGSEMNANSVITNIDTRQKWGTASPFMMPKVSIIDPLYQRTLSQRQTVSGALDAMAHILEYYFLDDKAVVTHGIDDALLKTIVSMTDRLVDDANDYDARANLAWAATLALNGISGMGLKGGDWACHQIEHSFSALYPQIVHGEGLGVIFPAWIEYMSDRNPEVFNRWSCNEWGVECVSQAVRNFRDKIKSWGAPTTLSELGLRKGDIPELLKLSMISPRIGQLSKFDESDVEALLLLAL